jgi:hypothetical protein
MKIAFVFLFFLNSIIVLQAQIQGVVVEKKNKLPVPFASIKYETGTRQRGLVADKQGRFSIPSDAIKRLQVSCLGYKPQIVILDGASSLLLIELEEQDFLIQELLVTPQNNPALRIIRKVLENKEQNNHEKYPAYAYRCYFKTTCDLQTSATSSETDSLKLKNKFDQAILVSETVTLCSKLKEKVEERIIAVRTSGMETSLFGQVIYTTFYKTISFYNHSIRIYGETGSNDKMLTDYLSPLSDNCLGAYNYQLEEEYVTGNDTLFEISYFPKKNKNFNALMGTMFISSNGYAVANIMARPHEKGLIDFKFKQDYKQVNGKWFPENLEEEVGFPQFRPDKQSNAYITFFVSSKIDSVSFELQEKQLSNRLDRIFIDEKSIAQSCSTIDSARPAPLSERELKAYHWLDSLSEHSLPLDMVMNSIVRVDEGKIALNKIDLDLARIYSYNRYEGSRYGLGLYTNEHLLKFVTLGGYAGYGVKDKKMKYGGDIEFIVNRNHDWKIKYSYQNSLKEPGNDLPDAMDFLYNYFRNAMAYRFDHIIENKIEGKYHISRPWKVKASFKTQNLKPLYDYSYKGQVLPEYKADEIQLFLRYAPGERHSSWGGRRLIVSNGNPVFKFVYTRGINFLRTGSLNYNKWEALMDVAAYNGRIGQSNLRIEGGYIDRSLPYGLLFTGEGSKDQFFSLLIANTFQTMLPYEFLSDRYAHVFYSHNFGALLFKTKIFSPEFLLAYHAGWGNLANASYQGIDFGTKSHVYQETGLIIHNILRFKYLNMMYIRLGIGGFFRYGYYRYDKLEDNLALKAALSISFK